MVLDNFLTMQNIFIHQQTIIKQSIHHRTPAYLPLKKMRVRGGWVNWITSANTDKQPAVTSRTAQRIICNWKTAAQLVKFISEHFQIQIFGQTG